MIGQIKKQVVSWKIVKCSEKHNVVDLWNKLVLSLIIIFEPQKFGITMKGVCSSWKQEQVKMVKTMPSLKRKKQEKVKVTNCRLKKAILVISLPFLWMMTWKTKTKCFQIKIWVIIIFFVSKITLEPKIFWLRNKEKKRVRLIREKA